MDKKAKKILFQTYWSSKGWKMDEERQTTPEDFAYAKEKGVMFEPITITHDECVKRLVELAKSVSMEQVAKGFLCSLSTRRLDWRSAVSSYETACSLTEHKYTPVESGHFYEDGGVVGTTYTCGVCSALGCRVFEEYENDDLNVLNFERIKWGGVRQGELLYTMFDLEQFAKEEIPEPVEEDIVIFRGILQAVKSCEPGDYPSVLRDKLAEVEGLKANKAERSVLLEILACLGVLAPKAYNRPEAGKHDWDYVAQWRGEDGYDEDVVEKYFGKYLK